MTQLTPGTTVSHYRILETLGRGGQATAFKAEDTRLNRTVVIKALRPELAASETARRRFEREACLCSVLDNPHIQARLRRGRDERALLHRPPVRGGPDPQAVHGRPAPRAALRALHRDPDRGRPGRRPRGRHRAPRPEAREHHRHRRRPGQDPRLRPGQDGGAGRGRGRIAAPLAHRRPAHGGGRPLRLDGLRLARAGARANRRPPHRHLQPRASSSTRWSPACRPSAAATRWRS